MLRPHSFQGDKAERGRNVFLEPIAEIKHRFNLTDQQILKLVGSAYGLRTAPRNWYQRVKRDLLGQGWKMHSLDNCVFLLYDRNELIGLCGVYVDDFLIAGRDNDPRWQEAKRKLINLYSWGKWEKRIFHLCGVRYRQFKDFSISMDQEEYTMSLNEANFQLPPDLKKQEIHRKLDGKGLKCLRAINGSLQWLVTNSRPDLAARVSLSASATSNPTYGDLQSANKLIRQAQRYKEIPINIPSIPIDRLTMGTFTDAAWAVRPDGSSQGGYLLFFADKDLLDGKRSKSFYHGLEKLETKEESQIFLSR